MDEHVKKTALNLGCGSNKIIGALNVDLYDVETLASEIETTLDTKTTLINQAIDTDTTLGGIVTDIHITDRDFEYESAGANSLGVARMKYQVIYTTHEA